MSPKPPKTRLKAAAQIYAPQTRDEVAGDIRKIGDLQRDLARAEAAMNDQIAAVTDAARPEIDDIKTRLETLQKGVQTWCEANRAALTTDGKVKFANLVTGEVSWRTRPPSCVVRGVDAVIDTLKRLSLARFVRTKEEVNKEAILNEPGAVQGVAGISIISGVEDFVITPFEQEVAA